MKMCEDFALNCGDKRIGCCITTTHFVTLPFSPGNFFTKNNMTVVTHQPYFSLFPQLKGRRFETIEVTEAKLQAALKTLTEHDFQDEF
jgi:hypothetical protein